MRKTLAVMLVKRALAEFQSGGWKLKKSLVTSTRPGYPCAECDTDARVIVMYPKIIGNGEPPLAKSLLHELVSHLLLNLSASTEDEEEAEWWEKTVWRQLPPEMKTTLKAMLDVEEPD